MSEAQDSGPGGEHPAEVRGTEASPGTDLPSPTPWAAPQQVWSAEGDPEANRGPDNGWTGWDLEAHEAPAGLWQPGLPRRPGVGLAALSALLAVAVLAGIGIGRSLPASGTNVPAAGGTSGAQGSIRSRAPGASSGASGAVPGTSGAAGSGASGSAGAAAGISPSPAQVAAVAARITPALVDIDTALGYAGLEAAGTGIILSANGLVLTNNHVVSGETSLNVVDVGTGRHYSATVLGYDVSADVALLRLRGAAGLHVAPIARGNARLGEQVVAVGNAGGRGGAPTAAGGTITALDRSITASDQGAGTTERLSGLIQTSANVQLGDSGGSLVDARGGVVGVDTAASLGFSFSYQGNQGFAIPIRTALAIARRIEAGRGSATVHIGATAFIGVRAAAQACTVSPGAASVPAGSGAVVCSVLAGTPAARSGLRPGDLITAVGGQRVVSPTGLTHLLIARYYPGDRTVIAFVARYGKGPAGRATVTLGSGPPG